MRGLGTVEASWATRCLGFRIGGVWVGCGDGLEGDWHRNWHWRAGLHRDDGCIILQHGQERAYIHSTCIISSSTEHPFLVLAHACPAVVAFQDRFHTSLSCWNSASKSRKHDQKHKNRVQRKGSDWWNQLLE